MNKPRKRCENCSRWSSTDKVWGDCMYASTEDHAKIAQAQYVISGLEHQATLETRYDFACRVWQP